MWGHRGSISCPRAPKQRELWGWNLHPGPLTLKYNHSVACPTMSCSAWTGSCVGRPQASVGGEWWAQKSGVPRRGLVPMTFPYINSYWNGQKVCSGFPWHLMEKPVSTFWPTQCIHSDYAFRQWLPGRLLDPMASLWNGYEPELKKKKKERKKQHLGSFGINDSSDAAYTGIGKI